MYTIKGFSFNSQQQRATAAKDNVRASCKGTAGWGRVGGSGSKELWKDAGLRAATAHASAESSYPAKGISSWHLDWWSLSFLVMGTHLPPSPPCPIAPVFFSWRISTKITSFHEIPWLYLLSHRTYTVVMNPFKYWESALSSGSSPCSYKPSDTHSS